MKLPQTKIEKAAATNDRQRAYLNYPHADVESKRLIATDGHIMAILPIEDVSQDDTSGPIPLDALQDARKRHKRLYASHIEANGTVKVIDGPTYPRPQDIGKFPDYDRILTQTERDSSGRSICINAELLHNLALAICDSKPTVRLTLPLQSTGCIRVEPMMGVTEGRVGVIMPVRDDEDRDGPLFPERDLLARFVAHLEGTGESSADELIAEARAMLNPAK